MPSDSSRTMRPFAIVPAQRNMPVQSDTAIAAMLIRMFAQKPPAMPEEPGTPVSSMPLPRS